MDSSATARRRRFSILSTDEALRDPYPVYEWLRRSAPVYWSDTSDEWIVTRHADVRTVLQRPDVFSSAQRVDSIIDSVPGSPREEFPLLTAGLRDWMLFTDGSDHTRLRRDVERVLLSKRHDFGASLVAEETSVLLASMDGHCEHDVVADLAGPLPLRIIINLLGVPIAQRSRLADWSLRIAEFFTILPRTRGTAHTAEESYRLLRTYLLLFIAEADQGTPGLVLDLINSSRQGGRQLSSDELVDTLAMLIFQAHETTKNLIANTVLALARDRLLIDQVSADPVLINPLVNEVARLDGSIQFVSRVTLEDTTIRGTHIRKGQLVLAVLASANRDDEVFDRPNDIVLDRSTHALQASAPSYGDPHSGLSFGVGKHSCPGRWTARAEVVGALTGLLTRFTEFHVDTDNLVWRDILSIRALESLPMHVGAVAADQSETAAAIRKALTHAAH